MGRYAVGLTLLKSWKDDYPEYHCQESRDGSWGLAIQRFLSSGISTVGWSMDGL